MKTKGNKMRIEFSDFLKANRIASRELELQENSGGWRSVNKVHKSKRTYSRKKKHKEAEEA